jgi:hypothetical protein
MVAALALTGALPEKPTGSEVAWSIPSADAKLTVEQTATETGCHLQVHVDGEDKILWEKDGCFGGKSDPKFLSPDGSRLIVFASYPASASEVTMSWRNAPVVWLFDKGTLVESGTAGQLVRKDLSAVRDGYAHFAWLQGLQKVPGVPPHFTEDGKRVEFDAIDGSHGVVSFTGLKLLSTPVLRKSKN